MSRSVKCFSFPTYPQGLINTTHDYLIAEGYEYKSKDGEMVYQKGHGLMMGPTFVKITIEDNLARIEAWIKMAILPGVYAGEEELESFVGSAVKGPVKKRFAYIEQIIYQYGGTPIPEHIYMQQIMQKPLNNGGFQPMNNPAQPPQIGSKFCSACGSALAQGMNFCTVCGTKVE